MAAPGPYISIMGTPNSLLRGVPLGGPLTGHTGPVRWGAWGGATDDLILATGGDDGTVRLWDPVAGTSRGEPLFGHPGPVRWGMWGRVGDVPVLATGGDYGTAWLWYPESGTSRGGPLTGHTGSVWWGAWASVGGVPVLATGGDDGTVRLWDPAAGTSLGEPFPGHIGPVRWGAWASVGGVPVLATGGDDGTARLWWYPESGMSRSELLTGHTGSVRWGAWGKVADDLILATGGDDGTVRLWNPRLGPGRGQQRLTGHAGPVPWGAWGSMGHLVLATGGHDGTVREWTPMAGPHQGAPIDIHTGPVLWGAWASVGDVPVLATGGGDGTVRLWHPEFGRRLGEPLSGQSGPVRWGVWGRLGTVPVLATGGDDGTVRLWEVVENLQVTRLPSYRSDMTAAADELDRTKDAMAVAQLITARTAKPPLAVGLFGDWGEGKSHFLRLLQDQVETTTRLGNLLWHRAVRQVRFNAWHYAETDLWASLVAELFAQLSAPVEGDLGAEQRRQSRLTAELVGERGLRERLDAARARHRQLQTALSKPADLWDKLPEDQKRELRLLAGDRPEQMYRQAAQQVAALRESGRASWRIIRSASLRTTLKFLVLLLALITVTAGLVWWLPAVWPLIATIPGLASVWAGVVFVRRTVKAARHRTSGAWARAQQIGERQRLRLETATEVAATEVTALEQQLHNLTAAGQLAGLVAECAKNSDYRSQLGIMSQIRGDFERMAALLADAAREPMPGEPAPHGGPKTADTGAGSQDNHVAGSGTTVRADEVGDELPQIDRIVLYIDDLDRCPPRRVVEMLEAIHLLLAVELFVVVVAVDPRWLLRAIECHYRDLLHRHASPAEVGEQTGAVDPNSEELWHSTPAQYLEKIFQVVLTLPPLDCDGYRQMLRTLIGARPDHLAASGPAAPAPPETESSPPEPAAAQRMEAAGQTPSELWQQGLYGAELPAARVVERIDPLTLEPDELELLDLLGPPLLVATPRGVKRLANSYGLLTQLRGSHRQSDLAQTTRLPNAPSESVSYFPYRAGMVLLAVLVAYPSLGPALFLHLHHTVAQQRDWTWLQYVAALTPHQKDGRWRNPADPHMTPVEAQRWQALLQALDHVTTKATEAQLDLPEPLTAWAEWIVPVGRLSFPTGRIVSGLERSAPLPSVQPPTQ
ncbi:P-loop NTPase fold protein [Streptomyces sp. Y7]|uniref:P-loop NTPase fold protein n=1 Tax=Streptomyces sp. Y7 TaxID=3342392 RepID=UPI003719F538